MLRRIRHRTDARLVVEVADSSAGFDREVKLPLYAQASVPEVWLVNLPADALEIYVESYAQPPGGKYRKARELKRGGTINSGTHAQLSIAANAVLGGI
jgi:Uma2 family endonuclease